jgi:vancomycin permeability regulator SanA
MLISIFAILVCNIAVIASARDYISAETPKCDAIVILGAKVYDDDTLSSVLKDRVETGCQLYNNNNAQIIIMSGSQQEAEAMKKYAIDFGIPEYAIKLDTEGLSTFESAERAKEYFEVDSVIMVTQLFHIHRAVYLGRAVGLETYGVACAETGYTTSWVTTSIREPLARVKAIISAWKYNH